MTWTQNVMGLGYYGGMASRKMTFSLPESLAEQFVRRVPPRHRSRFVSEALASRLEERDLQLIRACEAANQDQDVLEIEKEFDAIQDEIAEPWARVRSAGRSGGWLSIRSWVRRFARPVRV